MSMSESVAAAMYDDNSQSVISRSYDAGMSRKERMRQLIDERYEGNSAAFARDISRSPNVVWQYLNGYRQIGEKFARHVESKLRLENGWMDTPKGPADIEIGGAMRAASDRLGWNKKKKPKDEIEFIGHMDAWDSNTPLDPDEVELPLFREVELSAGAGQTQVQENHGAKLRFAKSTLSRANVAPENAACAFVTGNSMEPVMPDGTTVGVNTADTGIRDGEIYALDHDGMLRVKYLYRKPGGGMMIRSQNQQEHPDEHLTAQEVSDENIRVIGRVFWWSVLR